MQFSIELVSEIVSFLDINLDEYVLPAFGIDDEKTKGVVVKFWQNRSVYTVEEKKW